MNNNDKTKTTTRASPASQGRLGVCTRPSRDEHEDAGREEHFLVIDCESVGAGGEP